MDIQSMVVGFVGGVFAVPVLIGLFKSLKSWPRNIAYVIRTITNSIRG